MIYSKDRTDFIRDVFVDMLEVAMGRQKEIAEQIVVQGGAYVLAVKENPPQPR